MTKKVWTVELCKTIFKHRLLNIEAETAEEAKEKALDHVPTWYDGCWYKDKDCEYVDVVEAWPSKTNDLRGCR